MHKDLEVHLDRLIKEKDNEKLWDELLKRRCELGEDADLNEVELLQRLKGKLHLLPEKAYPYLLFSLLTVEFHSKYGDELGLEYFREFYKIFGAVSQLEKISLRQISAYLAFVGLFPGALLKLGNFEKKIFTRLTQDEEKTLFVTCVSLVQSNPLNFLVYWCLGYMSYNGIGTPQDFSIAIDYFQKATDLGHAISCDLIGTIYNYGSEIIPRDEVKAALFFQQAALQGLSFAQSTLYMSFTGGVISTENSRARDLLQDVKWCRNSAEQGLPQAQHLLAEWHRKGLNVKKDEAQAAKWYKRAARQGCLVSERVLYEFYEAGIGVDAPNLNVKAILSSMAEQNCEPQKFWPELIQKSIHRAKLSQLDLLNQLLNHFDSVPVEAYLDLFVSLFQLPYFSQSRNLFRKYAVLFRNIFEKTPKSIAEKSLSQLVAYIAFMSLFKEEKIEVDLTIKQQHEIINRLLILTDSENPLACFCLGQIFFIGLGVEKDVVRAGEWIRRAAEMGLAVAQYCLGRFHENGIGVTEDLFLALRSYQHAMAQEHVFSSYKFFNLNYVETDPNTSRFIPDCRKAAVEGDASAQYRLGHIYKNKKEYENAVVWFQKAAEQGHHLAIYELSLSYLLGNGVPQNPSKAIEWMEKGADEERFAYIQYQLAQWYYYGLDGRILQNIDKAFFYFQQAAEQGNEEAQYHLGLCYEKGTGVSEDKVMALHWYRKSVEQGNRDSQDAINRIIAENPALQHERPRMRLG